MSSDAMNMSRDTDTLYRLVHILRARLAEDGTPVEVATDLPVVTQLAHLQAAALDALARRRADSAAAREREADSRAILNATRESIWVFDPPGNHHRRQYDRRRAGRTVP